MAGVDNVGQVLAVAIAVTAMISAGAAIGRAGVWLWQIMRRLARLADDLMGEPARGHQPARSGVLDRIGALENLVTARLDALDVAQTGVAERVAANETRLAAIEAQLRPNGGASLRDAVDRIADTASTRETAA